MSVHTLKQYTANLSNGNTIQVKAINPDYALEAAEQQAKKNHPGAKVRSVARIVPVPVR